MTISKIVTPQLLNRIIHSVILYRVALEEILKEAKRGKDRAETMGPMGWCVLLTLHFVSDKKIHDEKFKNSKKCHDFVIFQPLLRIKCPLVPTNKRFFRNILMGTLTNQKRDDRTKGNISQ